MADASEHALIWVRPEPGGRRPRLSREQIAQTALRIADTDGFDAVTMKRIATGLGAGTMSLYYYVRTKADIVALMQDAILAEVHLPESDLPKAWREAVAVVARRTREVLLAHPWSLSALNEALFGPHAMRHMEQSLAALDHTELDGQTKFTLLAIIDAYVSGNVLQTVESLTRAKLAKDKPALVADAIAFGQSLLETGEFPRLAALQEEEAGPPMTEDALTAHFEAGLEALLDGLDRRFLS